MAFQWIMRHEILIIFDNSSNQLISKFMSSDIIFFLRELCTDNIEGVTVLNGSEPDLKDRWIWHKIRSMLKIETTDFICNIATRFFTGPVALKRIITYPVRDILMKIP